MRHAPLSVAVVDILVANFQLPGPGLACPPISALGTSFWVAPFRTSAVVNFLPPFNLPCVPVPAAIPPGLKVYCQFVFRQGTLTLDATEGLAITITAPWTRVPDRRGGPQGRRGGRQSPLLRPLNRPSPGRDRWAAPPQATSCR